MKITKIEQQQSNTKRYSVFVDGEFACGLSDVDLLHYKLKENDDISSSQLEYILDHAVFAKARDKALHYLAHQARTEAEVREKLQMSDYTEEIIERVITLLKRYDYVNDARYASDYAQNRAEVKGLGSLRIKRELRERGVDITLIEQSLAETGVDEFEKARGHLYKKMRGNPISDEKTRRRCFDYLMRRGFSVETAVKALKDYEATAD